MTFIPAYIKLHKSGELQNRVEKALEELRSCRVCPRNCDINRLEDEFGVCKSGRYARVGSYFAHFGEEDILRGKKGSGTIFFSFCNLKCVFCQNFDLSWKGEGGEVTPKQLASMMIELQDRGCHNINFVTPEHVVPQVIEALPYAIDRGLHLPLVYNTSAYDSLESLKLLDGIVDIYMPDFKFMDSEKARHYIKARGYPEGAKAALKEMHRQVGDLVIGEDGLAKRGLMVRHLLMPGHIEDSRKIFRFIAQEISPDTYFNIMAQYYPAGKVSKDDKYKDLRRRITRAEWEEANRAAVEEGLTRLDDRVPMRFI